MHTSGLWTVPRPAAILSDTSELAGVTQLVECLLPKQNVVGSSPITRSKPRQINENRPHKGRSFVATTYHDTLTGQFLVE